MPHAQMNTEETACQAYAGAVAGGREGGEGLEGLLKSVSRSFYLTMRFLPPSMRPAVSLAYLLARATDTVADTAQASEAERVACLRAMAGIIEGSVERGEEEAQGCFAALRAMSPQQTHAGENELLYRFEEIVRLLFALPDDGARQLVQEVLATITSGQVWDIEYFTPTNNSVATEQKLLHYAYQVAGCVGEFWTKLGLHTMGHKFSAHDPTELLCWGKQYGQALQLINIIRDEQEDSQCGRTYIPPTMSHQQALTLVQELLPSANQYARTLSSFRLRFATLLPALIGEKTLILLINAPAEQGRAKVKIPRRSVYACLIKALWRSL